MLRPYGGGNGHGAEQDDKETDCKPRRVGERGVANRVISPKAL